MHLTPRETQVLELVDQGKKNSEIAAELGIAVGTAKIHKQNALKKRLAMAPVAPTPPPAAPPAASHYEADGTHVFPDNSD
jgi:hypothetical protein